MITTIYIPKALRWLIVIGLALLVLDVSLSIIQRTFDLYEGQRFTPRHRYETTLSQAQEELGTLQALEETLSKEE